MSLKSVIIVISTIGKKERYYLKGLYSIECYSNLKLFCEVKGYSYNTLSKKKYPFIHDRYIVYKIPLKAAKMIFIEIEK